MEKKACVAHSVYRDTRKWATVVFPRTSVSLVLREQSLKAHRDALADENRTNKRLELGHSLVFNNRGYKTWEGGISQWKVGRGGVK